jgi:ribosomal protein L11 methyltransferase
MGCGSGILAMAYAKTAHRKTIAVDNDPDAVAVAAGNVRVNGLQQYIRAALSCGYHSNLVRRNAPYDLILSNILAKPLSHMAKDARRNLRPGGIVILSGILTHQANMVLAAHRMQGLYLLKHLKIDGWSVLALSRRNRA